MKQLLPACALLGLPLVLAAPAQTADANVIQVESETRILTSDRVLLRGHEDGSHAPLADRLEQLERPDDRAWAGSRVHLTDPFEVGRYVVELRDPGSGDLIFVDDGISELLAEPVA